MVGVVGLLVVGGVALLVFLVFREFWTWYWKQSEQVRLLKEIAISLQRLEERGRGGSLGPDHAAAVRLGLGPARAGAHRSLPARG